MHTDTDITAIPIVSVFLRYFRFRPDNDIIMGAGAGAWDFQRAHRY